MRVVGDSMSKYLAAAADLHVSVADVVRLLPDALALARDNTQPMVGAR